MGQIRRRGSSGFGTVFAEKSNRRPGVQETANKKQKFLLISWSPVDLVSTELRRYRTPINTSIVN
jgi:hypothetical protein